MQQIQYKNSTLSYAVYGRGPRCLLAFHGYGKTADSLSILGDQSGTRFRIVSIEIFGHGGSVWKGDGQPSKEDWKKCIDLLLDKLDNPGRFSVFGYSIGGRVAALTTFLFKERVELLWLMGATGIGGDGFYNFAVNTVVGRRLFKTFVSRPGFVTGPFKALNSIKFIPDSLFGFVHRKIDTQEKRSLLYQRWLVLRHFGVTVLRLKQVLNQHAIKTLLVFGKKDTVVDYKTAVHFSKDLPGAILLLPNAGHYLLNEEVLGEVEKVLQAGSVS